MFNFERSPIASTMLNAMKVRDAAGEHATQGSCVPPFAITYEGRMEALAKHQVAATIAAGVMAAQGRPFEIAEAVQLFCQVQEKLYAKIFS
ncbi:MAG: hypothetical protein ACRYGM_05265 [Janthinobacterium lividum]